MACRAATRQACRTETFVPVPSVCVPHTRWGRAEPEGARAATRAGEVCVQKIENPVPRVAHPDWLHRSFAAAASSHKQRLISNMFAANPSKRAPASAPRLCTPDPPPAATCRHRCRAHV